MNNLTKLFSALTVSLVLIWPLGSFLSSLILFIIQIRNKKLYINTKLFYTLVLLFIFVLLKVIYLDLFSEDYKYILKFLLLIIVLFSINSLDKNYKNTLIKILVYSVLISQIYSILHIVYFFSSSDITFLGFKNFSYVNPAIGFERPYIGFLSAISVLIILYSNDLFKKKYRIALVLVSVLYVSFIVAKLAIVITLTFLFLYLMKHRKYKIILGGIFLFILFSFSVGYDSVYNRFAQIKKDERIKFWKNGIDLIKEDKDFSYIWGSSYLGFRKMKGELTIKNVEQAHNEWWKEHYRKSVKNLHNEYFTIFIFGGFIGLTIFLLIFLDIISISIKYNSIILLYITLSIMLFMFVENIFERRFGIMIFGILIGLFYPKNHK